MPAFKNAKFTPEPLVYDKNAPYTRKNIVLIDNKLKELDSVIAENMPNKKTMISPEHKVLYKGKMQKARELLGVDGIYKQPYDGNIVYNVLLEKHTKMVVHGMIVETLAPKSYIASYYNGSIQPHRQLELMHTMNTYYLKNKATLHK